MKKRISTEPMSIRVAIFDDNKYIRNGIQSLLETDPEFTVAGMFSDADDCVNQVMSCNPDVVLMDIQMPGVSGIEAVRQLKHKLPNIQILIQTVFEDEDRILESILAGASGYILKSGLNRALPETIRELQSGGAPMTPLVARKVMNIIQQPKGNDHAQTKSADFTRTTMATALLHIFSAKSKQNPATD